MKTQSSLKSDIARYQRKLRVLLDDLKEADSTFRFNPSAKNWDARETIALNYQATYNMINGLKESLK